MSSPCPCGSALAFDDCCGPIIDRTIPAPTAEALMRSRYTAFTLKNIDHLEITLADEALADYDRAQTEQLAETALWEGLSIVRSEAGGVDDKVGVVEFIARYHHDGKPIVHHETATFRRGAARGHENGDHNLWLYVDGHLGPDPRRTAKVGRNDPCPCGSGKKYKKCHGG